MQRSHQLLSCYVLIPQQKGRGSIDQEDLQTVCRQFQLPVSGSVLDDLMDYCDTDGDGLISFVEFANFLSWKDMMPINGQEECILTQGQWDGGLLLKDGSGLRTS